MSPKKRGLGKGLDALLSTSNTARTKQVDADSKAEISQQVTEQKGELRRIAIELLVPGVYQPRKDMSPDALDDLASSIKAQGIIQPIIVREIDLAEGETEQKFEIIAGERRWRAAQLAKLDQVPCLVKEVDDRATVAIALIENIQREDLNAMEEAIALDRLINEFELTHQQVADEVGKSRTTVSNLLRLNTLNDDVKLLLERGDIDMGHARALLGLGGDLQSDNARIVADKNLTVRETERLVQKTLKGEPEKKEKVIDPNIASLQQRLTDHLGAAVSIKDNGKGKGKMTIAYSSLDELDGVLAHLNLQSLD